MNRHPSVAILFYICTPVRRAHGWGTRSLPCHDRTPGNALHMTKEPAHQASEVLSLHEAARFAVTVHCLLMGIG